MRETGNDDDLRKSPSSIPKGLLMLIISAVACEFYLRYVGRRQLISLSVSSGRFACASSCRIRLYDSINGLRQQNAMLILEKKIIHKQVEKYEEDYLNKSVEFISGKRK